MAFSMGTRLGAFEILSPLGAGGKELILVQNWSEKLKRLVSFGN